LLAWRKIGAFWLWLLTHVGMGVKVEKKILFFVWINDDVEIFWFFICLSVFDSGTETRTS
jgi:hypothetical protein